MKKKFYYGLITLFFLSYFYIASGFIQTGDALVVEDPLVHIFDESGAAILESNINTTLIIPDTLWSQDEIEAIKEELKRELDLEDTVEILIEEEHYGFYDQEEAAIEEEKLFIYAYADEGSQQILASHTRENGDILTFKIHSADAQGEKTSYIIIDIIQNKRYKQLVEQSNQYKGILEKYGDHIETTMQIVGTYEEKMSVEERQHKIQQITQPLNPQLVEDVAQESYVSTTIYTPTIPYSLQYSDKSVNLQLAMRYNDFEEKTYLYIATPLITMTY